MKLRQIEGFPEAYLNLEAISLHRVLGGPSLIHIPGRRGRPLFVSVLLHGNETVGWYALRDLLYDYRRKNQDLPRPICLFIGNTEAAEKGVRALDHQTDFNRAWPGSDLQECAEHELMRQVVAAARRRDIFASIDLHNNTGINPHYACVNELFIEDLTLASLFGRILVYFRRPLGVQSLAMGRLAPAVTVECGKVGEQQGVEHAREFIDACLHIRNLDSSTSAKFSGVEVFHTVAVVRVPGHLSLGFTSDSADLRLVRDVERCNFHLVSPGWTLASCNTAETLPLLVTDENGEDVFHHYFELIEGRVRTRVQIMPSMLTSNLEVIRQDCLCYLMEPIELTGESILSRSLRPTTEAAPRGQNDRG